MHKQVDPKECKDLPLHIKNAITLMEQNGLSYTIYEIPDMPVKNKYKIVIGSIAKDTALAMKFFTNPDDPSIPNFPGKEAIKERFNKEIGNKAKCTSCAKGKIIRKFLPIVKAALYKNVTEEAVINDLKNIDIKQDENTRIIEVSGSGSEGDERAKRNETVLRKATSYFKQIFSFGKKKGTSE